LGKPLMSRRADPSHSRRLVIDSNIQLPVCSRQGVGWTTSPNKRMQLTKLRAAPVRQAEVPPSAPAGETDGGTASQLIRSVRRTERLGGTPQIRFWVSPEAERKADRHSRALAASLNGSGMVRE
jgi:hypothetical protein